MISNDKPAFESMQRLLGVNKSNWDKINPISIEKMCVLCCVSPREFKEFVFNRENGRQKSNENNLSGR